MPNPLLPSFAQLRQALVKAAAGGPLDQGTKTTRTPPVDIEGKAVPTPVDPHWEARQAYLP
jgi:hypothetical protein